MWKGQGHQNYGRHKSTQALTLEVGTTKIDGYKMQVGGWTNEGNPQSSRRV